MVRANKHLIKIYRYMGRIYALIYAKNQKYTLQAIEGLLDQQYGTIFFREVTPIL